MTSKHCPHRSACLYAGTCQNCDHGKKYERMAAKIRQLDKARKTLRNQHYVNSVDGLQRKQDEQV